jgi:hypothetical protein
LRSSSGDDEFYESRVLTLGSISGQEKKKKRTPGAVILEIWQIFYLKPEKPENGRGV